MPRLPAFLALPCVTACVITSACAPVVVEAVADNAADVPADARLALRWYAEGEERIDSDSDVDGDGVHRLRIPGVPDSAKNVPAAHQSGGQLLFVRDIVPDSPEYVDVVAVTNLFLFHLEVDDGDVSAGWHLYAEGDEIACTAEQEASCAAECREEEGCTCGGCFDWTEQPLDAPAPMLVTPLGS